MRLDEILKILDAETLYDVKNKSDIDVELACGCDLMSDVLAYIKSCTSPDRSDYYTGYLHCREL